MILRYCSCWSTKGTVPKDKSIVINMFQVTGSNFKHFSLFSWFRHLSYVKYFTIDMVRILENKESLVHEDLVEVQRRYHLEIIPLNFKWWFYFPNDGSMAKTASSSVILYWTSRNKNTILAETMLQSYVSQSGLLGFLNYTLIFSIYVLRLRWTIPSSWGQQPGIRWQRTTWRCNCFHQLGLGIFPPENEVNTN